MRDDLLHAQASVDWAISQLPTLENRIKTWLNENFDVVVKQMPDDTPNNVLVAIQKQPLPLSFQVEVGAYINTIRSSLDILACALAGRHCKHLIDDTYFPIVKDASTFVGNRYKGSKFIQALPKRERSIIESLKPYEGGNKLLYALHLLDILRKHQRLLAVDIRPNSLTIMGVKMNAFTPVSTGWMNSGDDETVIGLLSKGATHRNVQLTMQIGLKETRYLDHWEVVAALREFAGLANSIIKLFDF